MITKRRYAHPHPKLGRHVNHDSESRRFTFRTEGLQIKSVVHQRHIPILDQGEVGSCTGDAGIGNLGTSPLFDNLAHNPYSLDQAGVLKLYNDEENLDGDGPYPPNDNGSSGLTCAKVLAHAGVITSYQHCFDISSVLLALSAYPFLFGCDWHERMFTPDADGRVRPTGAIAGGHEILCREFDQNGERLIFDNSWGESWGLRGRFYLTLKDFESLLNNDGDVIILMPPTTGIPRRSRRQHHHHHHGSNKTKT